MSRKRALGKQKFTRRLEISAVLVENSARLAQNRGKRMEISAFCQAAAELGETKFCKACSSPRKAPQVFGQAGGNSSPEAGEVPFRAEGYEDTVEKNAHPSLIFQLSFFCFFIPLTASRSSPASGEQLPSGLPECGGNKSKCFANCFALRFPPLPKALQTFLKNFSIFL